MESKEFLKKLKSAGNLEEYEYAKKNIGKNIKVKKCKECGEDFEVDKFIEHQMEEEITICDECEKEMKGQLEWIDEQMYPDDTIETNYPDDL